MSQVTHLGALSGGHISSDSVGLSPPYIESGSVSDVSTENIELYGLAADEYSLEVAHAGEDTDYTLDIDPITGVEADSGYFTALDDQVSVNFIADGGAYKGEVGLFNLEGMHLYEPGGQAFIKEAARRALSGSHLGDISVKDSIDKAQFDVDYPWEGNFNSGTYAGFRTFDVNPGDKFGIILVPNGTIQEVFDNPGIGGKKQPLFSLGDSSSNGAFHVGQLAAAWGNIFVMEDQRVDLRTDRDYNDIIFQVKGAKGNGLYYEHEDSKDRCRSNLSWDFTDGDADPSPYSTTSFSADISNPKVDERIGVTFDLPVSLTGIVKDVGVELDLSSLLPADLANPEDLEIFLVSPTEDTAVSRRFYCPICLFGYRMRSCHRVGRRIHYSIGGALLFILVSDDDNNDLDSLIPTTANIIIIGGTDSVAGNLICGNDQRGIYVTGLNATNSKILGNYVGTDVTGTQYLGNTRDGLIINNAPNNIVGGTESGSRNLISGNKERGIYILGADATGDRVLGNYVGTDVTGTQDLGNTSHGIWVGATYHTIGGTTDAACNLVSGNDATGIYISNNAATGDRVLGNYVGTDITGTQDLGNTSHVVIVNSASNNTIGGTTSGAGNLVSGNDERGIYIYVSEGKGNKVFRDRLVDPNRDRRADTNSNKLGRFDFEDDLKGLTPGSYELRAVAYDKDGAASHEETQGFSVITDPGRHGVSENVKLAMTEAANLDDYHPEALKARTRQWTDWITPGKLSADLAASLKANYLGATRFILNSYNWAKKYYRLLPPGKITLQDLRTDTTGRWAKFRPPYIGLAV